MFNFEYTNSIDTHLNIKKKTTIKLNQIKVNINKFL
jgi:hypothetical protein